MRVIVLDAFEAASDPKLPALRRALNPADVERRVAPLVARAEGRAARTHLRRIRVARHKPGRRCLVEYRFGLEPASAEGGEVGVFGKLRSRGTDVRTHELLVALWQAGFRPDDGRPMAVPEPIGVVPDYHMILQREAPGRVVTELVAGPEGVELMERVADAIHALHSAGIPARRRHTLVDELRILDERLGALRVARPQWARRIEKVLEACRLLASGLEETVCDGIHRDFHPDQLLVEGRRLTLLDLDLYAAGDPALDVGNFVGHLTELGLRCWGDPEALRDREEALEERYSSLSGVDARAAFRAYATLTLVRHVHISTTLSPRRSTTSDLLELCEQRLGIARSLPSTQKFRRSRKDAR